ncbi:MAG: glycerate kinase [Bacteroidota bacterium]|nr:glycerate kinase [Bacteroidota bacterium]
MHILIAPNAFKNSLTANLAAEAISKGLQQSMLACSTVHFPVGDGGDGTGALLMEYMKANRVNITVHDPLQREINSCLGFTFGNQTAVIELADASGLRLLQKKEYDPLHATTFGTGELIQYALEKNVKKIILCIGGSATVDGGMGILQALGMKFLDADGAGLPNGPLSLSGLKRIDVSGINKKIYTTELVILSDVENLLLGANGAAAVFGPQKGASYEDVQQLDNCLATFRDIVLTNTGKDMNAVKYGGAAGGVGASLHVLLHAKLVNGIEYFLDSTGFDKALAQTDLLITGEGSIDAQTLQGKAPFGVARRAKERSIPVIALAGKVPLKPNLQLQRYFDILLPINHEAMDIETAIQNTYDNLLRTSKLLGDLMNR